MVDDPAWYASSDWCEPVRRVPQMFVGTDPFALAWLVRQLLEAPRAPTRVVLAARGAELRIEAASIPPSPRPRAGATVPYLIELCTTLTLPLDEPPTIAGVEVFDTSVDPAVFRSSPRAPPSLAIANALSVTMSLASYQGGWATSVRFERGRLIAGPDETPSSQHDGMLLAFVPDAAYFDAWERGLHHIAGVVRDFAAVRRVHTELVDEIRGVRFIAPS